MANAPTDSMTFTRSLQTSRLASRAVAVLVGSALIAAAAQIEVPMVPVPMTMQTFAILAVGLLYGSRLGAATVVAYLVWAALGLPVLSGGANLAILLAKPFTAGYLVGFVVAAYAAGAVVERTRGVLGAVVGTVAGSLAIYAFGLAWLGWMMGDFGKAATVGAVPFLLGDLLKAALAVAVREGLGRVPLFR